MLNYHISKEYTLFHIQKQWNINQNVTKIETTFLYSQLYNSMHNLYFFVVLMRLPKEMW